MSASRKLLIYAGLLLVVFGMGYGLVYAVFIEHQTLDALGGGLMSAFVLEAGRDTNAAHAAVDSYSRAAYVYIRQVDAHSHWLGLASILLLLGMAFDGLSFAESRKLMLALALTAGAVLFPLGVLLQSWMNSPLPQAVAVVGAAAVTVGLAGTAVGFARTR